MNTLSIFLIVAAFVCIFIGIMLIKGYWQIPQEKEKREKVAIGLTLSGILLGLAGLIAGTKRQKK
jgi:uncharacterized membrane protein HdeD (DUF308 family)